MAFYYHVRGGTQYKVEPEFPDPFLCLSLCRRANTSPRSSAHTPAPGGKKEEKEGGKKKTSTAVNNRIKLNSWQGNDKDRGKAQHSLSLVHSSCAAMWVGCKSEPASSSFFFFFFSRACPSEGSAAAVWQSQAGCLLRQPAALSLVNHITAKPATANPDL